MLRDKRTDLVPGLLVLIVKWQIQTVVTIAINVMMEKCGMLLNIWGI